MVCGRTRCWASLPTGPVTREAPFARLPPTPPVAPTGPCAAHQDLTERMDQDR